jgi:S1-C subfamily serine protease/TPR repeat protein
MRNYTTQIAAVCMILVGCEQDIPTEAVSEPEVSSPVKVAPPPAPTAIARLQEPGLTGVAAELMETHAPRNDIERARNSTVFIDSGFGTGSGFFIDTNCTIVTNKHVIELTFDGIKALEVQRSQTRDVLERGVFGREDRGRLQDALDNIDKALGSYHGAGQAKEIKVSLVNGREMEARTVAVSGSLDLAYLYIKEAGCPFFDPYIDDNLPLGHRVFTIGNPAGMKYSVTAGIVSGYQDHDDISFIQTDAAINPGNSGGPLIDDTGRLLGVNSMILRQTEGIGFALPAGSLMGDLEENQDAISKQIASRTFGSWQPKGYENQSAEDEEETDRLVAEALANCIEEFDNEQWGGALRECRVAADHGDPRGQFFMAELTFSGTNRQSREQALVWYDESQRTGYAEALYRMGQLHDKGDYIRLQTQLAQEMFEEACSKDHGEACNEAALGYLNNNQHDAVPDLLQKAIQHGSINARLNLAYLYESGKGVRRDKKRAHELYEEAAMLGSNLGQLKLALDYYEGKEVKKAYKTAYSWALVAELDAADNNEGTIPNTTEDVRFALERMLNDKQKQESVAEARALAKEISKKSDTYRREHLYERE